MRARSSALSSSSGSSGSGEGRRRGHRCLCGCCLGKEVWLRQVRPAHSNANCRDRRQKLTHQRGSAPPRRSPGCPRAPDFEASPEISQGQKRSARLIIQLKAASNARCCVIGGFLGGLSVCRCFPPAETTQSTLHSPGGQQKRTWCRTNCQGRLLRVAARAKGGVLLDSSSPGSRKSRRRPRQ